MIPLQKLLTVLSVVAIMTMTLAVFVSVLFRYQLDQPIAATEDLLTILLGLSIFAAYAEVTCRREHVSVNLLPALFHGRPRIDGARRLVIDLFVLGSVGYIAFRFVLLAEKARTRMSHTQTMEWPLWPVILAFAVLMAACTLLFALTLALEWTGKRPRPDSQEIESPDTSEESLF